MKKTIAITSALAAVTGLATAEIKINDFLSFEGFVDMSYSHTDVDGDNPALNGSENSFAIDQVEIDWLFNFGKVTGQIDLQYENNADGQDETLVEQAFASYDLGNGAALTVGRYESMLGLEAKEPTGLYQYSTAYEGLSFLPQYGQGVKYTGQSGDISYGISLQDESFDNGGSNLGGTDGNDGSYSIEAAVSLTSGNFTYSLGGAFEDADEDGDNSIINAHVVYVSGAWTFGAEYNHADIESDTTFADGTPLSTNETEVDSWLVMANYAYSDCCSVTGRVSSVDYEDADGDLGDAMKYTLAHNYALTDNLAIITEVSYVEGEIGGVDSDSTTGAVEVLFTF